MKHEGAIAIATLGNTSLGSFVLVALICSVQLHAAHAQVVLARTRPSGGSLSIRTCDEPGMPPAVKDALSLVCSKPGLESTVATTRKAIVVGFLGGFVRPSDRKHPEVWFGQYLRDRYGSSVYVQIYGNREEKRALSDTIRQFHANGTDSLTAAETQTAVIAYGHSWGASQVLAFAWDLGKQGIKVDLTIQIDSVRKIGQDRHTVPRTVARAVNFYQIKGLTPGGSHIVPADAEHTTIIGNFQMIYDHQYINCNNYSWLSRLLNKPHHQIENDPRVWDRIASLIDSELTVKTPMSTSLLPPENSGSQTILDSVGHRAHNTVEVVTRKSIRGQLAGEK